MPKLKRISGIKLKGAFEKQTIVGFNYAEKHFLICIILSSFIQTKIQPL